MSTQEEVAKKREEFWDTRVEGSPDAWRVLRMAVDAPDSSSATEIIKAAGLRFATDQLAQTYDDTGVRYDLPPFIMSEPVRYGKRQEPAPIVAKDARISLVVRSSKAKDQTITVSTLQKANELKRAYSSLSQLPLAQIRLFFNGRELKDDDVLAQFNLSDQVVVQCMVVPP